MSGSVFSCGDISIYVENGGLWLLFSKDDFVRVRECDSDRCIKGFTDVSVVVILIGVLNEESNHFICLI